MRWGDPEWCLRANGKAVIQQARRALADLNDWLIETRLSRHRRAPPRIVRRCPFHRGRISNVPAEGDCDSPPSVRIPADALMLLGHVLSHISCAS
jgi:hypothetical protein